MSFENELTALYTDAVNQLTAAMHAPAVTYAERRFLRNSLHQLHDTWSDLGVKELEVRAAELNILAATLNNVTTRISESTLSAVCTSLKEAVLTARTMLVRAAREAFPDANPHITDNPEAQLPAGTPLPEESQGSATEPPAEKSAPVPPSKVPEMPPPKTGVPAARRKEYERLFETCIIRPEHVATMNSVIKKLRSLETRYVAVGHPLGIPWWFIGIVHGLEASFNMTRHLHNGDPLTARTVHVPEGRPKQGEPPFDWEVSATDALSLMELDTWTDWSVAGTLFKWEEYNGFGYRKYNIRSPYLWSFSNHYEKGRYVADHVFDPNAISKQCGAATTLRALINQGLVNLID